MIELRNVGKVYGRRRAVTGLRDVTLTIPRGQVTAVVGPNGAGKSTLFAVILGFLRPTAGDVTIAEIDPRDYVRENGAGYLPERFSLPAEWPVQRALAALGGIAALDRSAIDTALDSFGLEEHRAKPMGALSHGLRQRVGLAQAFAAGRDLIVLDEPAEGLDPVWRVRLRNRITEYRALGRTVLLASHDVAEVERIADNVIILENHTVREVLHLGSSVAAQSAYRIRLEQPFAGITEIFPYATSDASAEYLVHVANTTELNAGMAALIGMGARIISVTPATRPLEDRISGGAES